MTAQQPLTYDAFVELAVADSAVVGLVLKGSQAHDGMITPYSDHDLYVVLADDVRTDLTRFASHRSAELDLVIVTLTEFCGAGMPGWERYALARARIALGRLNGGIAHILADWARLDADEAFRDTGGWLDAYANSLYRSVKNHRDGRALAARLDAADSMRFLLELVFALNRRPHPYNKWKGPWESKTHRSECHPGVNTGACSVYARITVNGLPGSGSSSHAHFRGMNETPNTCRTHVALRTLTTPMRCPGSTTKPASVIDRHGMPRGPAGPTGPAPGVNRCLHHPTRVPTRPIPRPTQHRPPLNHRTLNHGTRPSRNGNVSGGCCARSGPWSQ